MNYKYYLKIFTITSLTLSLFSACSQDLSIGNAEKLIMEKQDLWEPEFHELKIVEGDFIPVGNKNDIGSLRVLTKTNSNINNIYELLRDNDYINFSLIKAGDNRLSTGEEYLTDIYKIQITDKIRPFIQKTTKKTGYYGVFPAEQNNWSKNKITYDLHLVRIKIFDKEFVRINSINDLRKNNNDPTDCDLVATYVYLKKYSDIGNALDNNTQKDTQHNNEACFKLVDNKWNLVR
ncbi:MAG: hypothetical protein OEM02_15935 [Desulfobulbaceae bacterium]|nr:hypothetical protein [Desulfobulbaceae bacterium]